MSKGETYRVEVYQIDPLMEVEVVPCATDEEALKVATDRTDAEHMATPIAQDMSGATRIITIKTE